MEEDKKAEGGSEERDVEEIREENERGEAEGKAKKGMQG